MLYTSSQRTAIITSNWALAKVGNNSLFDYYNGVVPENPSGNKNIKSISFFDADANLKHKLVFTYDADDDVLTNKSL